jgi:hypothetical protein
MTSRRSASVLASSFAAVLIAAAVVACGGGRSAAAPPGALVASQPVSQTRTAKANLIQRLTSPPKVVIFGGSRAMRFDPAYIRRRTGLSAFNAAVMQARPEDAWALLNQLNARFPAARFRFLWVVHADEFDPRPIDLAILTNPLLARSFPAALVKAQLPRALALAQGRQTTLTIDVPNRGRIVYAPDGFAVSGFFNNRTPPPNGNVGAVGANIEKALLIYGSRPVALNPRPVKYFQKDLRLMDALAAAPPVIVAAPFDQRIFAATVNRGWGAHHRLLLGLLAQLRSAYRFSYLDLSKAASFGFTPSDFYDGIHLTPQGAQKVIDLVLKRFPGAL